MGRVVRANLDAVLARLEDPTRDAELTIREMEEGLRLARRELVSAVASEKQLRARVEDLGANVERWKQRAELAVRHADDALAREALRWARRLEGDRTRAEGLRAEQLGVALDLRADLERAGERLETLRARRGVPGSSAAAGETGGAAGPSGELRRMEDRIEGVEAAIAARQEVDAVLAPPGASGLSPEEVEMRFRALEGAAREPADDVDDDLRALKSKLRVEP